MMRIALATLAAAVLCSGARPSDAQTIGDAPWCAVTDTGAGRMEWDCEYRSIRDCAPNVLGGNRGFCQMNPAYRAPPRGYSR